MLYDSTTLGHKIVMRSDRTGISANQTPVYNSPVTAPVVTFDSPIKMFDGLIIPPVIIAMVAEGGLHSKNARLFGTYPKEDLEGFKDDYYLRASIEQDNDRGFLLLEQENGHYTAGMIMCPMASQFPTETGSEWMVSEVYISDGANYHTFPVSSEDQDTLQAVSEISTLVTNTNRTIRKLGLLPENERQDAWDKAKRSFTSKAVDIIEHHGLLESPESPGPIMA